METLRPCSGGNKTVTCTPGYDFEFVRMVHCTECGQKTPLVRYKHPNRRNWRTTPLMHFRTVRILREVS